MDNRDQTKKCFCARCFLPIDVEDRVDVEGQSFHRICSTCCICRTIPSTLKMFYGHVFCNECFKTHVLTRFRGETPMMHSANSWWMQWGPATKPQESTNNNNKDESNTSENTSMPKEPEKKRFICSRCLHAVDEAEKIEIGGQCFHPQCAKCYFCQAVPKDNLKIYYGQVFCEQCFQDHVMKRNKDNPNEFFKNCFENWQNNAQFAENMRSFMGSSKGSVPFVFMMQGQEPPFCKCGAGTEWGGHNEARKSATPGTVSIGDEGSTWDLSFENRTEFSDIPESYNAIEDLDQSAAEKIEKLTKYLHELDEKSRKKWKNFVGSDKISVASDVKSQGWVELLGNANSQDCPKCLWQCGPIYVNSALLKRDVCCGDVSE